MVTREDLKQAAALAALRYVKSGFVLGLGTGSTTFYFLEGVGRLVAQGMDVRGVPTSLETADLAKRLGIPLTSLDKQPRLDLAVDGADEVDPQLNLIKGLGGALFRERIVALASKQFIVIVDESKLVPRLGVKAPIPVEVHPFGWRTAAGDLEAMGARVDLRRRDGKVYRTDNENVILDARFPAIRSLPALAAKIQAVPAVVAHGLFLGMASAVIVGTSRGFRTLRPKGTS